jgi:hypothetical protein
MKAIEYQMNEYTYMECVYCTCEHGQPWIFVQKFILEDEFTPDISGYICRSIIITNTLDFHNIKLFNIMSYVSKIKLLYMLINIYECHI